MPLPNVTPKLQSSFHRRSLPFRVKQQRHNAIDISRNCQAWPNGMTAPFGLQTPQPGGNRDVSLQNYHRSATSSPDSAQAADRGKDRLQRAQSDGVVQHANLHSESLI
jgi:hypothetical protein